MALVPDKRTELSDSDKFALREMSRNIWVAGLEGFALGLFAGVVGSQIVARRMPSVVARFKLEKKHYFAAPMFTAASGSLLGSLVASKNNAHTLHYILHKNAGPPRMATTYQAQAEQAKLDAAAPQPDATPDSQHNPNEWEAAIKSELGHAPK
mmetsp:Transcript_12967/g.24027  ORF Transcript_12967/g.24027 Transcript_12967/m.24027 type:complete len:153 (+) Transcript_12967:114-572(+)